MTFSNGKNRTPSTSTAPKLDNSSTSHPSIQLSPSRKSRRSSKASKPKVFGRTERSPSASLPLSSLPGALPLPASLFHFLYPLGSSNLLYLVPPFIHLLDLFLSISLSNHPFDDDDTSNVHSFLASLSTTTVHDARLHSYILGYTLHILGIHFLSDR